MPFARHHSEVLLLVAAIALSGCDLYRPDPPNEVDIRDPYLSESLPFGHISFDSNEPGSAYTFQEVAADFGRQPLYVHQGRPRGPHGVIDSLALDFLGFEYRIEAKSTGQRAFVADSAETGQQSCDLSIRVEYPAEKAGFGAGWYWNIGRASLGGTVQLPFTAIDKSGGHDHVYFHYRTKFGPDFQFVQTGKLAGLAGGLVNTGGIKPTGSDGWSVRVIWSRRSDQPQGEAEAALYVYHADQPGPYGQIYPLFNDPPVVIAELGTEKLLHIDSEQPVDRSQYEPALFKADSWYDIEIRVSVNTPGERDGALFAWIDDQLVMNMQGLFFRDGSNGEDDLKVKWVILDTIFGGNTPDYAPRKDETAYFDDFTVSNSYIGSSYAASFCGTSLEPPTDLSGPSCPDCLIGGSR